MGGGSALAKSKLHFAPALSVNRYPICQRLFTRGFWIRSRSCLRPAADEAPRRTRGKTSGTQGNKSSKTSQFLKFHSVTAISPGPGSAVGEKGKKRGQIGKISAKEASRGLTWGRGKGRATFPPPLGSLRSPIFFSFFPTAEPGPRLNWHR